MEPIAIVGIDAAGTDDIDCPSAFWDFLQRKGDAYRDFPADRINVDAWYHPQQGRPGSFYTQGGCFLQQDPRLFDPSMFGISPQEARTLDPAQRKLLETVYEAFESSGTPLAKLSGSATGCFIGNFNYDHQLMQFRDAEFPEPYAMTGSGITMLSNRISYIFDLHGPSLTLDTACSSSMYALHLACSAIESGECTAAVVGGSNLILSPECQLFSAALGAVSRTSCCHTFDAAADGYARAEGIGVLYIKKLSQAVQDGDPVRAVIRATAINANGRTGGITHPDPSGQERAIRRAYQRAGHLDPALTSYFECHGTGTPVGDPLEVEAIGRVFAAHRTTEAPLLIGSVKSNMGHCEAASGIAGIIKAVLALENKVIPPIRELKTINPNVDLQGGRLHIVQESVQWPECTVRRASVNSFGYGGANAHTILEEVESLAPGHGGLTAHYSTCVPKTAEWTSDSSLGSLSPASPVSTSPTDSLMTSPFPHEKLFETAFARSKQASQCTFLLPVSAHNEQTLRRNIDALLPRLDQWDICSVAYTLGCRRSTFAARSFVIATREQLQKATIDADHFTVQRARSSQNCRLGFVFTGQGAQWPEMGKTLMETFHVYLESIRNLDRILDQLAARPDWSIEQALQAPPEVSRVHEPALSQPLVTAVQIALVDLLASWNVLPTASVGHSSGEIAAAYAAGYLSAAEAIIIAYARGRAVSSNPRKGAMLAVSVTAEEIAPILAEHPGVRIACYNSPRSLTLSGDQEPIHEIKTVLDAQNVFARVLQTGNNAYHSAHMKGLGEGYEAELDRMLESLHLKQRVKLQPLSVLVSSVTNSVVTQPIQNSYWRDNLESPVLFSQATTTLLGSCPVNFLVEIGPHSALRGPLRQITKSIADAAALEYLPTITRSEDCARGVLNAAGTLWSKGFNVDFEAISSAYRSNGSCHRRVIVDLPKYQWHYAETHYVENRWTREWRLKTHLHHDILGSRQQGGNHNEPMWRNVLKIKNIPWLRDHAIGTDIVFPAAGYLSMAVEAALQMAELKGAPRANLTQCSVERLMIDSALTIPDDADGVEILFNLRRARSGEHSYHESRYEFTVTSVTPSDEKDVFTEHAHGSISTSMDILETLTVSDISSSARPISETRWYDRFAKVGLNYGPSFRCLSHVNAARDEKQAECTLIADKTRLIMAGESSYAIHPTALDSAIQLAIVAAHRGRFAECSSAFLPVSVEKMTVSLGVPELASAQAIASSSILDSGNLTADVSIRDSAGRPLVSVTGFELVRAESIAPPMIQPGVHPFSRMVWKPDVSTLTTEQSKRVFQSPFSEATTVDACPPMDKLALNLLVQLFSQHHKIFSEPVVDGCLERFLTWMTRKVDQSRQGTIPGGSDAFNQTIAQRSQTIEKLIQEVSVVHGPEARFMCHMFESYPQVFAGEITGIQAAVHANLLSEMYEHMELYHRGSQALGEVMALISHDKPSLDIFEIGGGTGSATREILHGLRGGSDFRGYNTYTFTDVTPSFLASAQDAFQQYNGVKYAAFDIEKPVEEQGFNNTYDVLVASNVIHVTADMQQTLTNIRRLLRPGGKLALFEIVRPTIAWVTILGTFPGFWKGDHDPGCPRLEGPFLTVEMWKDILPRCGFSGVDLVLDHFTEHKDAAVMLATATEDYALAPVLSPASASTFAPLVSSPSSSNTVVEPTAIVYQDTPSSFCLHFQAFAKASGLHAELVPLHALPDLYSRPAICLAEVERSLFTDCSEAEWAGAKAVLLHSASTLWVTRGGLLQGSQPESAMISGLVAAVHAEDGAAKTVTLDLDFDSDQDEDFSNILLLSAKAANYCPGDDFEYRCRKGVLYTSRLVDDEQLNRFEDIQSSAADTAVESPLEASVPCADEALPEVEIVLADGEVLVQVCAKGTAANNAQPTGFNDAQRTILVEFAGVVTSVGASVTAYQPGDRIYGLCSNFSGNLARPLAQLCRHMQPDQSFIETIDAAAPAATCTALYGVQNAARLAAGESIFIRASEPTVRLISALCAVEAAAVVFAVVASEQEKSSIIGACETLPLENVLIDQGQSISEEIMRLTNNQGVDAVLSDASSLQVDDDWQLLAPFGRYVRFSQSRIPQSGNLAELDPSKCAFYTSFSLDQISLLRPALIQGLLERADEFRLTKEAWKEIVSVHVTDSDNRPLIAADTHDGLDGALNDDTATITASPSIETAVALGETAAIAQQPGPKFDPEASYLLIGCLGGLGRSFAAWMVSHGARNLVFLSRSGTANAEAADFVEVLRASGTSVQVVIGDVSLAHDVDTAVAKTNGKLKGIVQAPLTLNDAFLHAMTREDFFKTVRPRVTGTLNLHRASKDLDLDFFMLWSSWTKVLGSTSQANYMASSAFMDAFAVHRRALGLPATSLSLGHLLDVGIVSSNLDYQEHLMHMGLYGNSETEFLHFCERAVSPLPTQEHQQQHATLEATPRSTSQGHLLAGLEPAGLAAHLPQYPLESMHWFRDPRFAPLLQATNRLTQQQTSSSATATTLSASGSSHDARIALADDDPTEALLARIHKRVARCLYLAVEDIDVAIPITNYGIDSMVAAQIRNWLVKALGANVSLFLLLHPTTSVERLTAEVEKGLVVATGEAQASSTDGGSVG